MMFICFTDSHSILCQLCCVMMSVPAMTVGKFMGSPANFAVINGDHLKKLVIRSAEPNILYL